MKTEFLESKGPSAISRVLGISRQTVTNYIRGESCMTVDHALKLARYYGVSLLEVVDPDYQRQNQGDLIAALDSENRLLRFRLQVVRDLLVNIDADLRGVIDGIGVSDGGKV